MTTVLLSTTYFGPIQWYQKIYRYDRVLIEQHESFLKQTYRNRCIIATTQGIQVLTVPVIHSSDEMVNGQWSMVNVKLSDHGNWRHVHWQAIASAYGDSPFFEYYENDLRPFFFEHRWEWLIDYNEAICQKMCELLDIHPQMERTTNYISPTSIQPEGIQEPSIIKDFRTAINPKHPLPDTDFTPHPYYQVFREKHGFLPNLSILDLLFNMGPESIIVLSN